ncbi:MAG: nicotinate (nicotinamide) nucleotide adenylyltransferase [Alphaproteobacteria bacterium]|nr:nicotinate (nicotinamide) nucleotide adenylyltransferase [Alphaproteobacteria bacterium]MCL2505986.1 nicotinate (nicotinamide) nucleotide adenylyltransferase [Alphaproteobacteria bacterium]
MENEKWKMGKDIQGAVIGVLGGSFNPVHMGHLEISLYAKKIMGLDRVFWLVSPHNPLKDMKDMMNFDDRLELARRLVEENQKNSEIFVSDIEKQINTVYTIDTIEKMKWLFPDTKFVWLMGADNLMQIHKWKDWERLFHLVPMAVFKRGAENSSELLQNTVAGQHFREYFKPPESAIQIARASENQLPLWTILDNSVINISSTQIRNGV